ncbi:hypothetical protein, partial [Phascolarctobacterium sp.]|uniref:hypothetical protein n=1 Tax=Phascolarctobacterium sp. TaxID=2049039 RepID=UPI003077BBDB
VIDGFSFFYFCELNCTLSPKIKKALCGQKKDMLSSNHLQYCHSQLKINRQVMLTLQRRDRSA